MKQLKAGRGQSHIVNHNAFTDATPLPANMGPPTPGIGSPMDTFNPAANEDLPAAPKYVQPQGKRVMAKGLTNKRITGNV